MDANYRAHADACLAFHPVTKLRLSSLDIYLLLYLASEKKIRRVCDVQRRDGKEEPVIFMP